MKRLKLYLNALPKLILIVSIAFSSWGCVLKKTTYHRTEVEKKIVDALRRTKNLEVVTKITGNTLHIYIPIEEEILKTKRTDYVPKPPLAYCSHQNKKYSIKYAFLKEDVSFSNNIGSSYTSYVDSILGQLYSLLFELLTDDKEQFDFFVIDIADILRGMEVVIVMNEKDLKRSLSGELSPVEIGKRMIMKTYGGKKIISDKTGKHVDYKEVILNDYIDDLIVYVIKSSVDTAKLDPKEVKTEILKAFGYVMTAYGLSFDSLELYSESEDAYEYFYPADIENLEDK